MPSGSRKVSTSSSSRVARRVRVDPQIDLNRSCHQPSDEPGTLNAVAVVIPAPCRPSLDDPATGRT